MGVFPTLPPEYETWMFAGGCALARRDAADATRAALAEDTLYEWAGRQEGREAFTGRGTAWGARLGAVRVVLRHARRGGALAPLLRDRYLGSPRFLREIAMSHHLNTAGIATPAVVAAVEYPAGIGHRADVATERVNGRDLAAILFGDRPPEGEAREGMWRAVGGLVRRLHDAGFVHPDLQLRNVLMELPPLTVSTALTASAVSTAPTVSTAWLLDVDTCRRMTARAERARNLGRFRRSWDKWNRQRGVHLVGDDWDAFLAAYEHPA